MKKFPASHPGQQNHPKASSQDIGRRGRAEQKRKRGHRGRRGARSSAGGGDSGGWKQAKRTKPVGPLSSRPSTRRPPSCSLYELSRPLKPPTPVLATVCRCRTHSRVPSHPWQRAKGAAQWIPRCCVRRPHAPEPLSALRRELPPGHSRINQPVTIPPWSNKQGQNGVRSTTKTVATGRLLICSAVTRRRPQ